MEEFVSIDEIVEIISLIDESILNKENKEVLAIFNKANKDYQVGGTQI